MRRYHERERALAHTATYLTDSHAIVLTRETGSTGERKVLKQSLERA